MSKVGPISKIEITPFFPLYSPFSGIEITFLQYSATPGYAERSCSAIIKGTSPFRQGLSGALRWPGGQALVMTPRTAKKKLSGMEPKPRRGHSKK